MWTVTMCNRVYFLMNKVYICCKGREKDVVKIAGNLLCFDRHSNGRFRIHTKAIDLVEGWIFGLGLQRVNKVLPEAPEVGVNSDII